MLIEVIGTALLVGLLRGGRFANMKDGEIQKWYLFVAAFAVEFLVVETAAKGYRLVIDNILYFHAFSYILLFIALYFNRNSMAFRIIAVGILLNFAVIMANGGHMPVSEPSAVRIGLSNSIDLIKSGHMITHKIMDDGSRLKFLADILTLGKPYPRPKIFSIGDLVMDIGVFLYIQGIMAGRMKNKKNAYNM